MGKNALLAGLTLLLAGFGVGVFFAGEADSPMLLAITGETAVATDSKLASEMSLGAVQGVERVAVEAKLAVPSSLGGSEETEVESADLSVTVVDTNGAIIPGAKIVVSLAAGVMVTRWASSKGQFSLLKIPLGELSVTSPGYRVMSPTPLRPAVIERSGNLKVVVEGITSVRGAIRIDFTDSGEIRLFKELSPAPREGLLAADRPLLRTRQERLIHLRFLARRKSNGSWEGSVLCAACRASRSRRVRNSAAGPTREMRLRSDL